MGTKAPEAFRTISEVSEILETPPHVLRFWESKFTQLKPVKRAGGRRYYRPSDLELLAGIKQLLHEDGMTIRGVQKLLREQGVKHVASLGAPLEIAPEQDPQTPSATDTAADGTGTGTHRPHASAPSHSASFQSAPPQPESPVARTDRAEPAGDTPDSPPAPSKDRPASATPAPQTPEGPAESPQQTFPFQPQEPPSEAPDPTATPQDSAATARKPTAPASDDLYGTTDRPLAASLLRRLSGPPPPAQRAALRMTLARMRGLHARLAEASDSIAD